MTSIKKLIKIVLAIQLAYLPSLIFAQTKTVESNIHEKVKTRTELIFDSLVSIRRDFHTYPELAEQEKQTSNKIATSDTTAAVAPYFL